MSSVRRKTGTSSFAPAGSSGFQSGSSARSSRPSSSAFPSSNRPSSSAFPSSSRPSSGTSSSAFPSSSSRKTSSASAFPPSSGSRGSSARGASAGGSSAFPALSSASKSSAFPSAKSGGSRSASSSGGASSSFAGPSSSSTYGSSGRSPPARTASGQNAQQLGLRQIVQKRFLDDVLGSASKIDSGWKVLIVDDHAMKVISAAVGMYDIMERKITLVEALHKVRAPFKDMGAVYILDTTKESIDRLLDDFSSKENVKYGSNVFVYFLGAIPDHAISQIKACRQLIKRLKTLTEININFLTREERAFQLDMPNSFASFYLRTGPAPVELSVAEKLVTLCATLNEYPYIRFKQSSGVCSSLASLFHLKMDEFVAANPTWWYHGSGKSGNRGGEKDRSTLLLLDRADDCVTPLMHDLTYQAMVHDLLQMKGDQITYQAESAEDPSVTEDKDVLLNEKDSLWVELRGKHIAQVIEILSARIQEVVNSSTGSSLAKKKNDGSTMSLSEMASALKALPEYREVMGKLSQHMHLAHECMNTFNKDGLLDLSDIEQTLATGKDEDGRTPKFSEIIGRVESALIRQRDPRARLRLILLATISQQGLPYSDRDRLLRAAQLPREEMAALDGIEKLGIATVNNTASSGTKGLFGGKKGKLQASGSFDEESEYTSMRYVPSMKSICTDVVNNSLSIQDYPSVVPMPDMGGMGGGGAGASSASARRRSKAADGSARKKKSGATSKWSRTSHSDPSSMASAGASQFYTGARSLVFMVGGISYSELRVAREVMEKESREIIVGSTSFLSPSEFLDDVVTLSN